MKRVLFFILVLMMVSWVVRRSSESRHRPNQHRAAVEAVAATSDSRQQAHRHMVVVQNDTHRILAHVKREVRQALDHARNEVQDVHAEIRQALAEANQEVRDAHEEVRQALVEAESHCGEAPDDSALVTIVDTSASHVVPNVPPVPGIPPIPPVPTPPLRKAARAKGSTPEAHSVPQYHRTIKGLVSATEERAREEARKQLESEVSEWLEPSGVPRSWAHPTALVDGMILESRLHPIVKDYGTVYEAEVDVDMSPDRRGLLQKSYQRQLVQERIVYLGGALAFALTCLAAVSGYIRADEVTKGYYTNKLRLLAAAGVGAAGMAIYHVLA